jgi:hypothetical protein
VVTAAGCYLLSGLKKFFPNLLASFPAIETHPKTMLKVGFRSDSLKQGWPTFSVREKKCGRNFGGHFS